MKMVADVAAMSAMMERIVSPWSTSGPGGAILVFDRSGYRFSVSGGLGDLAQESAFDENTVVRLASITKHVLAAMVLSAANQIGLEDPLLLHLPELQPEIGMVKVAQALSMTGGLPDLRECLGLQGLFFNSRCEIPAACKQLTLLDRLNFQPDTELSYSNTGYRLVETALARKGLDFAGFVESHVRRGAGAPLYTPEIWGDTVAGLVPGYWETERGWQPGDQGMPLSASGCLCGSASALADWLRHLIAGQGSLATLFSQLAVPRTLLNGRCPDYGLGLYRMTVQGRTFVGHDGSLPGYKACFLIDPASGCGVVVTSNREDTAARTIARSVLTAGFGLTLPDPVSPGWASPGFYVDESGTRWIEVRERSIVHMGAEEPLFCSDEDKAISVNPTAPVSLRSVAGHLAGEIGFSPMHFAPALPGTSPDVSALDGIWIIPGQGALLEIRDGVLIQGTGPQRSRMTLRSLGRGLWLFRRDDGPWSVEVRLKRLSCDQIELATARARSVIYERLTIVSAGGMKETAQAPLISV